MDETLPDIIDRKASPRKKKPIQTTGVAVTVNASHWAFLTSRVGEIKRMGYLW